MKEQEKYSERNGSLGISPLPVDMQFHEGNIIAICMYSGLMVFSTGANVHMLSSLVRIRRSGSRSRVNFLLLNLTIADLLVTFLMMPMEIVWNATVAWLAGDLACRILSIFRVFGLYLSSFVLMCISIDRYYAIVKPLSRLGAAEDRTNKFIVAAWIASLICSVPQSVIFHVESHPQYPWYEQCVTFNSFPSPDYEVTYGLFGIVFMYIVPLISSICCYSRILYTLWRSGGCIDKFGDSFRHSRPDQIKRAKLNTLKMALLTLFAFTLCWTPYNIMSLWFILDQSTALTVDHRVQKMLFVFACSNSCMNPVIYHWYHVHPVRKRVRQDTTRMLQTNYLTVGWPNNTHGDRSLQGSPFLSTDGYHRSRDVCIIKTELACHV